ncbi:MAG TPA: hypothetical protein VKA68_02075 [bacterium]|nr:hypothetical protein [bacterium]
MKENPSPKAIWQHLLLTGEYSIGYFSVTADREKVRIYHYRTRKVTYLNLDESFEGMEQLCRERGYDLAYLLRNYAPKSFHSVNRELYQRT